MVNLHTHTALCGHAQGVPADYAAAALQKGVTILGFSDHTPLPDGRWPTVRMKLSELDSYMDGIQQAREAYPQLKILSAAECDYLPGYSGFYREVLLGEKGMDYLIGSVHFYPYRGEMRGFWSGAAMDGEALLSYASCYAGMLQSGLFLFGAHPDVFGAAISGWDDDCAGCARRICEAAALSGTPLEINTSGWVKAAQNPEKPRPYPLEPFWEIAADCGVKAVVNADAHSPGQLDAYLTRGYALAEKYGIEVLFPFGK